MNAKCSVFIAHLFSEKCFLKHSFGALNVASRRGFFYGEGPERLGDPLPADVT